MMSKDDRKTNLDNYLKERKTNIKNTDAVFDFIETEIEVNKNAQNEELIGILEDMEIEI